MSDDPRQTAPPARRPGAEDDDLARETAAALDGIRTELAAVLEDADAPASAAQRRRLEVAQTAAGHARLLVTRLAAARAEATGASRAKDDFIAMTSHELRTPLGAILIWSQLLKSGEMDPAAVSRAVGMIERSTKTLAQLIDDLLDASRIIAGKLTFEKRPLDLVPVMEAALEAIAPTAVAKHILVERSIADAVPLVSGDPGRLQQVVANLLANAVKFTPEGGRVQVRLERDGDRARIQITDKGIGINPQFLPFVFDRFRQADTTTTRKQKGLGLGLAISRHIVEQHGGAVDAASEGEGRGTTFTVVLPLLAQARPPRGERADAALANLPSLKGLRLLVVDDEEDAREAMVVLLGQAGARVRSVSSAAEAMEVLTRDRPDAVLSDIAMPGEDGYALIRRIRALPADRGGRVPAAALTAYATLEDRAKALRAGFDEHIPKPVEPTRLIGAVAMMVSHQTR